MVGHIYPDGRIEDFCRLLEYSEKVGVDYKYRIVTSSRISGFLKNKLSLNAQSILDIIEKQSLSDKEINEHMTNAFASLSMHTRVAQSGVTPVAFMNGTPIVARNIPMFSQFIENKINGRLVHPNAEPSEWLSAIMDVRNNSEEMSKKARKSYVATLHENNLDKYLKWILE